MLGHKSWYLTFCFKIRWIFHLHKNQFSFNKHQIIFLMVVKGYVGIGNLNYNCPNSVCDPSIVNNISVSLNSSNLTK